nr:protein FAR1-RELATED SEQUENCE 5-like [Ipomoea trifida]
MAQCSGSGEGGSRRRGGSSGYCEGPDTRVLSTKTKTPSKRRRVTNKVGCNAKIVLKRLTNGTGFVVFSLEERHTHTLCTTDSRPFMKVNWKLDLGHQNFIINCAKASIDHGGSSRSSPDYVMNISSGSTKYWTPECEESMKPGLDNDSQVWKQALNSTQCIQL